VDGIRRNGLAAVGGTLLLGVLTWIGPVKAWGWEAKYLPAAAMLIGALLCFYFAFRSPRAREVRAAIERAIKDAWALVGEMLPSKTITSQSLADSWQAWERQTLKLLRKHYGEATAREFYAQRRHGWSPAIWIPKQIEFLEGLGDPP
jgi:hypothetical protein